ncbi:MAG: bifunctional nuclease domain-containing protein [Bacteroidota bacterium]
MNKVRLNVLGLSYSQTQAGAYALILSEENSSRRIPIIIGGFEAQAIAIELEGMKPPRPLTHDLFCKFAEKLNSEIIEVVISKLEEGVFYSDIIIKHNNRIFSMDARTSDAIALALRFKCPIYTTESILAKAGIDLGLQNEEKKPEKKGDILFTENEIEDVDLIDVDIAELETRLENAVKDEDYELASRIRDELKRRKKD